MSFFLVSALLSIFWARVVRTQESLVTCMDEYKWTFNSKGETPCYVGVELMAICGGSGFTVSPLSPNVSYAGPQEGSDTPCNCSTVTWGLFSACGGCQDGYTRSWSSWAYNCTNVTNRIFPFNIPQPIVIPHWAFLDVGDDGFWNETAAKLDTENPPHPHHTPVGAIVGGVVGALAALTIAVALFVALRYRHRRKVAERRPSTLYGSEGVSTYQPESAIAQPTITPNLAPNQSMHQKLYDPYDPSTFPPPLGYDGSNTVYTSPPESPENHRTIIY